MTNNFSEFQNFGKEQMEVATTAAASFAKRWQSIAAEATDYSKRALETNSAYIEKLLGSKSFGDAVQTQSEYAKSAYAGFFAQATKMGEIFTDLAKESWKPAKEVADNAQSAADKAQSAIRG